MRRLVALFGALALVLMVAAPALAADPDVTTSQRVIISFSGDVSLPAGEEAAAVIVVQGNADIQGTANAVLVVGGDATLTGARVGTLTIVDGTARLAAGTSVAGDVLELSGTVDQASAASVGGTIHSMAQDLAGFALFIGFAAIAIWIGAALAMLIAGLVVAALAARQVRTAESVISHEPWKALLIGLVMIVLPPLVSVLLMITVVGVPLGLSLLFLVWPAIAFFGYLVAAIWIGEWLLRASGRTAVAERPYLAAVVGVIVAGLLGMIPVIGALVSIFGLGAVTIAGWRTFASGGATRGSLQPTAAPLAG
jgi:hypothetical protein